MGSLSCREIDHSLRVQHGLLEDTLVLRCIFYLLINKLLQSYILALVPLTVPSAAHLASWDLAVRGSLRCVCPDK